MENTLLCDACHVPRVNIMCQTCQSVRYCSDACGKTHWNTTHKWTCDAMAHANAIAAETGVLRRPEITTGPSAISKSPLKTSRARLRDFVAHVETQVPTRRQMNNVAPLSSDMTTRLDHMAKGPLGPGTATWVHQQITAHRKATHQRVLVDRWWQSCMYKAGVSQTKVKAMEHQWQRMEQHMIRTVETMISSENDTVDMSKDLDKKLVHDMRERMRANTFVAFTALGGSPEAFSQLDSQEAADKGEARIMAELMTRMADQYLRDYPADKTRYVKSDALTRACGFEPDVRWEGTDDEIEARFASGVLEKPAWWDTRNAWLDEAVKQGTFIGGILSTHTNPIDTLVKHVGGKTNRKKDNPRGTGQDAWWWRYQVAHGSDSDSENDLNDNNEYMPEFDDSDEEDSEGYYARMDERFEPAVAVPQDGSRVMSLWERLTGQRVRGIVYPTAQETPSPFDAGSVVTEALQRYPRNVQFADNRIRNLSAQTQLVQMEMQLVNEHPSKWDMLWRVMSYVTRWVRPRYLIRFGAVAGALSISALLFYGAYGYGLNFSKIGPDAFAKMNQAIERATETIQTQRDAIESLRVTLGDMQSELVEGLTDITANMRDPLLKTTYLNTIIRSGGSATVESMKVYLRSMIPVIRSAMGVPVGPMQELEGDFVRGYEGVLRVLENPQATVGQMDEAVSALTRYLDMWSGMGIPGMTPEQRLSIAQGMVTMGQSMQTFIQLIRDKVVNVQNVLGTIEENNDIILNSLDQITSVVRGNDHLRVAMQEMDAGTYQETLLSESLGLRERGGYIADSLFRAAVSPVTLYFREMHRWIRSEEARSLRIAIGNETGLSLFMTAPNIVVFTGVFMIFNHWKISWFFMLVRTVFGLGKRALLATSRRMYQSLRDNTRYLGGEGTLDHGTRLLMNQGDQEDYRNIMDQMWAGQRGFVGDPDDSRNFLGRLYNINMANIACYYAMNDMESLMSIVINFPVWTGAGMVLAGHAWHWGSLRYVYAIGNQLTNHMPSLYGAGISALGIGGVMASWWLYSNTQLDDRIDSGTHRVASALSLPNLSRFSLRNIPALYSAGRMATAYGPQAVAMVRSSTSVYSFYMYVLAVLGFLTVLLKGYLGIGQDMPLPPDAHMHLADMLAQMTHD